MNLFSNQFQHISLSLSKYRRNDIHYRQNGIKKNSRKKKGKRKNKEKKRRDTRCLQNRVCKAVGRRNDAAASGATTHLEGRREEGSCTARDLEGTRNRGSVPKRDPLMRTRSTVVETSSQVGLDRGLAGGAR